MTLIIFIIILSILILIHELGHFFVAKKNGVFVEEFGMGIPPRLWGKKFGETLYSLNWLPFGGFVKLYGEDAIEDTPELHSNPRSFLSKRPAQRAAILVAGVVMNFVLALALYLVLFSFTGFRSLNLPVFFEYEFKHGETVRTDTVVSTFAEDSPAEAAGMEIGMAIQEIDGVAVSSVEEVRAAVADKPGEEVTILARDLKKNTFDSMSTHTFVLDANEEGKGLLGVLISDSATIVYPNKFLAPLQHSANMLGYTGHTFKQFINIAFETKSVEPVSSGVSGPVGIYSVVGAILAYGGIDAVLGLLDFVALLSLSLAFINIMPLPALDGGRLVFVVYEMIFRKPMDQKIEAAVHKWGMVFFFGLLILITIKDIRQFTMFN